MPRFATTMLLVLLFWLMAATLVAAAHVEIDRWSALGGAATTIAVLFLTACAYSRLVAPHAGVTHALGVGITWLSLSIVAEIALAQRLGHGWFTLLGSPDRPLLRNIFLFAWVFAPAFFARERGPKVNEVHEANKKRLLSLSLLALGIVYGDIGTSPLYAMRECFHGQHAVALSQANVYGVLSLIFWTLVTVVTIKYHVYVIRFDNRGEGGILALLGLIGMSKRRRGAVKGALVIMGVFGAALLYGDGMITPAISVLSAVEGLEVATPFFKPYVIPITIVILVLLFAFQRRGTAGVGAIFGPITLVWFALLAVLGVRGILLHPAILWSINPIHAVTFFMHNGMHGF